VIATAEPVLEILLIVQVVEELTDKIISLLVPVNLLIMMIPLILTVSNVQFKIVMYATLMTQLNVPHQQKDFMEIHPNNVPSGVRAVLLQKRVMYVKQVILNE
jgi:hypothetical protein